MPSTAFHHLAAALTPGGGELRYDGDFDWPGVAIAGSVIRRDGARPWRMSAVGYIARGAGKDQLAVQHATARYLLSRLAGRN